jgi:hypothetical protein
VGTANEELRTPRHKAVFGVAGQHQDEQISTKTATSTIATGADFSAGTAG